MTIRYCKCRAVALSDLEPGPFYATTTDGGDEVGKHGYESCEFGAGAVLDLIAELNALRTATRLRRPMKLTAPRYAGPVQGLSRVPYEAFRAMLIDLSPTLTYFVEGVAFESGTYGASLRVKLRGVEVIRFLCDACTPAGKSWTFDAIEPLRTETNQDVACPRCHSPNDVRRA